LPSVNYADSPIASASAKTKRAKTRLAAKSRLGFKSKQVQQSQKQVEKKHQQHCKVVSYCCCSDQDQGFLFMYIHTM